MGSDSHPMKPGAMLRWAATTALIASLGTYSCLHPAIADDYSDIEIKVPATGLWADGTWHGRGWGYGGFIEVDVTIVDGFIVNIRITDAKGEDAPYLRDAKLIIPKVIRNQHTDLDGISGATTTTWGILDAVDAALKEASL